MKETARLATTIILSLTVVSFQVLVCFRNACAALACHWKTSKERADVRPEDPTVSQLRSKDEVGPQHP